MIEVYWILLLIGVLIFEIVFFIIINKLDDKLHDKSIDEQKLTIVDVLKAIWVAIFLCVVLIISYITPILLGIIGAWYIINGNGSNDKVKNNEQESELDNTISDLKRAQYCSGCASLCNECKKQIEENVK